MSKLSNNIVHLKTNRAISATQIRLVDASGETLGIVAIDEAMKMASREELDLVEIVPNANPPVCKIMDYAKYRYDMQKKKREAKKNQKVVEIKEIKLRPTTEINDYMVRVKAGKKFLAEGNKLKVSLRFKGREMAHQQKGYEIMNRLCDDLSEVAKIELAPKTEGRQIIMVLVQKV